MAVERALWEKVPGFNPRLLWFIARALKLLKPDVLQASGGRALKYGLLAKYFFRLEFSLVYRSIGSPVYWQKGVLGRKVAGFAMNLADGVVAVSDRTLQEFPPLTPEKQIRLRIHRGSDLSALREEQPIERRLLSTPEDAKVLIYVGSLSFEKCPLRAVEVFSRLARRNTAYHLWMLGEGPLKEQCRQLALERGVSERLHLAGCVQNVSRYFKAADVHLLTSDTEGLPGCLVESSALGVPSVAANVGGVSEILLDGETGFLVDREQVDDYVDKLQTLLNNERLRLKFGARASQWAENFSIEVIGSEYLTLYDKLVARKKKTS